MKKVNSTPVRVLEALEKVRDSGATNMFEYRRVILLADDYWSKKWLELNEKNYGNILFNDFSEYLKNG